MKAYYVNRMLNYCDKMKIFITILTSVLMITIFSSPILAHAGEAEKSLDEVISEILGKQNVMSINKIDCTKVFDAEFEELGDTVMERMAGSHELHEQMDAMMGGEGSESLRQMHIVMGKNWLGCGTDGFEGMMGGGIMSGGMMNGGMMPTMMRMMGNYYPAYYTSYNTVLAFGIAGWALFVVVLLLLALVFTGKIKIQKSRR